MDLLWSNSHPISQSSRSTSQTLDQNNQSTVTIGTAQMAYQPRNMFVMTRYQDPNMSHQYDGRLFSDYQERASPATFTPQSYPASPDSLYRPSSYLSDFRSAPRDIATPQTTDDGRAFLDGTNILAYSPSVKSRTDFRGGLKHDFNNLAIGELSEPSSQEWRDDSEIETTGGQKPASFIDVQSAQMVGNSLYQNLDYPNGRQPVNHTYPQFNNVEYQQLALGSLRPDLGQLDPNDEFGLQLTSGGVTDNFHFDHDQYLAPNRHINHGNHPSHPQRDFDFNTAPLYGIVHGGMNYSLFNRPSAPTMLPTQNDTTPSVNGNPSKNQDNIKDAEINRKLVQWRSEGLKYKQIIARGNWGIPESTLRGRYRTLTKAKAERVRKPEWDNAALSALVTAVDRFASPAAQTLRSYEDIKKIPWQQVAEWMHREKNVYKYGNATVKKKYRQLVASAQMQFEVDQWRRANGELPL